MEVDCTYGFTGFKTYCGVETPSEKLKRLEAEQRRIADELAETRKAMEMPKTKTRGELVAEQMMPHGTDLILRHKLDRLYSDGGAVWFKAEYDTSRQILRETIACAINIEIAEAKK